VVQPISSQLIENVPSDLSLPSHGILHWWVLHCHSMDVLINLGYKTITQDLL